VAGDREYRESCSPLPLLRLLKVEAYGVHASVRSELLDLPKALDEFAAAISLPTLLNVPVLATYFIRQFFGDFRQKFRLATKAVNWHQGG
jgi:hypothetical protein